MQKFSIELVLMLLVLQVVRKYAYVLIVKQWERRRVVRASGNSGKWRLYV